MGRAPVQLAVALGVVAAWPAAAGCLDARVAPPARVSSGPDAVAGSPARPSAATELLPADAPAVAPAIDTPLPYALVGIEGEDAVLAVSQSADDDVTLVQRLDGARQTLDPVVGLVGHHVSAAWSGDEGRTTLLTRHGGRLCLVTIHGGQRETSTCDPARADAVVKVGDRFLTLALDLPLPDEDAPPPRKVERKKKKRTKKARKERAASTEALAPARRKLALLGHWFGAEPPERRGAPDTTEEPEDPFETGVEVEEPMAGLGLVGAGVRRLRDGSARVDVVFHEWAGKHRDAKTKALGRARLGVAALDGDGLLVEGSRGSFGETDLFFGFLAGTLDPRLVTPGAGSVLLAQAATRGPCQATVVTPGRAPMGAARAGCALDPGRFLAAAERLRRPPKDRERKAEAEALDQAFDALATRLLEGGARRAEHQPAWDAPLAVVGPGRGFTRLGSGALVSFDRASGALRDEPTPLVARRARAYAAAVTLDGHALVRTQDGLRSITADGAVTAHPDPLPPGPPRADERAIAQAPFARVGESWWSARGGPVRLVPPSTGRPPFGERAPQTTVLAGGDDVGLFLELDGASLTISSLDAEGRTRRLARRRAPVTAGLDAAARDGGGALVVGPAPGAPDRLATFAVSREGAVGTVYHALEVAAFGLVPRLVPLPGGGAIVLGADGRHRAWLAPDGAVIGQDATPPFAPTGCVDGASVSPHVPTPGPAIRLAIPELAQEGTCVVGLPAWGRDGVLRLVTSRRRGADATVAILRAELAPAVATAPPAGGIAAAASPAAAGPSARCPADMVLVDRRFCVDRFETTVVEGATGRLASPDYPITPNLFAGVLGDWATRRERIGDALARAMPLPRPAPFQLDGVAEPRSTSRAGVLPNGYLTGLVARDVCAAAGKRLCTQDEFRTACRGEKRTRFPYGDAYREGVCNVARDGHPAAVLHGHASIGHLDPRLGRVPIDGAPGLRPTGSHPGCASVWDGDAIYDMVGNVDEWLDAEGGAFAGGFYARRTTSGCDAIVDNHPPSYLDYSTGVRCCATAPPGDASEPRSPPP